MNVLRASVLTWLLLLSQLVSAGYYSTPGADVPYTPPTISVTDPAFGGVGDGVTDNSAALAAAIASFPITYDGNTYSYAGTIYFPPGQYYFATSIQINRQVHLVGAGNPAGNALGLSQLLFADGIDGIDINHANVPYTGATDAAGTLIEGLYLKRIGSTGGASGNGVSASTRFELRNDLIDSFRGDGIHIEASAPSGNANNWHIENTRTISNGGNGLSVRGSDANAGTAIGLDASSNGANGIDDASFLGDTYIGAHTAANAGNGYKTEDVNARNIFIGCYSESGETNSIVWPSLVVGGILATGGTSLGTATVIGDGRFTALMAYNSDANVKAYFGGDASNQTGVVMALGDHAEASNAWPFRLRKIVGGYAWDWANNRNYFLRFVNSLATIANGYPRDMTSATLPQTGGVWMQSGFFIGSGGKYVRSAGAAPTTGTCAVGDITLNSAPTSGGFIGWVCTAPPATWKTFGAIN